MTFVALRRGSRRNGKSYAALTVTLSTLILLLCQWLKSSSISDYIPLTLFEGPSSSSEKNSAPLRCEVATASSAFSSAAAVASVFSPARCSDSDLRTIRLQLPDSVCRKNAHQPASNRNNRCP
jgi:hypothetical protein